LYKVIEILDSGSGREILFLIREIKLEVLIRSAAQVEDILVGDIPQVF
jgi:hypothetical protein